MTLSHSDRSILITGATSGIGLFAARELLAAGWRVIGTARTAGQGEALKVEAPGVEVLVADFSKEGAAEKLVLDTTTLLSGTPYALVNNAGFAAPGAIEDVDPEYAAEEIRVNLLVPAELIRGFLPGMRLRGGGRIINIA
jgi:NAD(P)-dependent dehydrogenase (short-subunit alcohol dehydrogenase family)